MKKLLITLMGIVFGLTPMLVRADMGAPLIREYEAYISNPNGVVCESNNKKITIPYNAKVVVDYEYGDEVSIAYNEESCNIKSSDIKIIKDKIEFKESESIHNISKEDKKVVVLDNNGIKMYKGDARAYDVVSTIPSKAVLKLEWVAENDGPSFWYGVTYEGKSGWIEVLDGRVGFIPKEDIYFSKDTNINANVSSEDGNNIKIGTVKKDIAISKDKYYTLDAWHRWSIYVSDFNGLKGYINADDAYYKIDKTLNLKQEVRIYKEIEDPDHFFDDEENPTGEVIGKISAGESIKVTRSMFLDESIYYVSYKGVNGWISYYESEEGSDPSTTTAPNITTTTKKVDNKNMIFGDLSNREIILVSIIGALILALTAVIIILLVSKSKKN